MFDKEILMKVDSYQIIDPPDRDGETFEKIARTLDFPSGVTYDPDYLYLWIRIVSGGEFYGSNKNGDYFPTQELISYYETFRDAHPFKNHENKNIEKAIGRIFDVRYDDEMKTVEVFKAIDRKVAPEIVRGYSKGYLTDVSMGCKVPFTVCSVCGNKARRPSEFCDHVKHHKLEYLETGERVYEINYEPKFHDSSVVLNGAERVAKAFMIIDEPSASARPAFKKVAKEKGLYHYVPFTDEELEKVASHRDALHPMLRPSEHEKVAGSDMLQKLAELEKKLTGKLVHMVGESTLDETDRAQNLMRIIRFLTDERMDADNRAAIAQSLRALAEAERAPVTKVFATFLGIAELLGITLYPTELHDIIRGLTSSGLDERTRPSEVTDKAVYPTDVDRTLREADEAMSMLPKLDDPSRLVNFYDEAPFRFEEFARDPRGLYEGVRSERHLAEEPTVRMISAIKDMLEPILPKRGGMKEQLLPRISIVLNGTRPLIGGPDVAGDIQMLSRPETMGDLMGAIGYRAYETARPSFRVTRMVRVADERIERMEKQASSADKKQFLNEKGIGRLKLMAIGLPAAYVASAFTKGKENNGERLTTGERFIADHPGMIGVGGAVLGKPVTALGAKGVNAVGNGAIKAGQKTKGAAKDIKDYIMKESSFNLFGEDFMQKVASEWSCPVETVRLLKVATLLGIEDMDAERADLMGMYGVSDDDLTTFFKRAYVEVEGEFEKAAEDFVNNLVIDSVMDARPLSTSLPGRMVDAFVFKKLMNVGKPKEGEVNNDEGLRPKSIQPPTP